MSRPGTIEYIWQGAYVTMRNGEKEFYSKGSEHIDTFKGSMIAIGNVEWVASQKTSAKGIGS